MAPVLDSTPWRLKSIVTRLDLAVSRLPHSSPLFSPLLFVLHEFEWQRQCDTVELGPWSDRVVHCGWGDLAADDGGVPSSGLGARAARELASGSAKASIWEGESTHHRGTNIVQARRSRTNVAAREGNRHDNKVGASWPLVREGGFGCPQNWCPSRGHAGVCFFALTPYFLSWGSSRKTARVVLIYACEAHQQDQLLNSGRIIILRSMLA
jgi:hypothetical protein